MRVGTVREIKNHEYRVGLTPASAEELVAHGHQVLVEIGAGLGIGANEEAYRAAGAEICATAADVFARADMIVKVKEPQAQGRAMLREGQILYTYLHLAPDPEQTKDLIASGAVCIAYETVTDAHGGLPLLKPMSQVAGRMSIQAGATALQKEHGVPGVLPANVVVIGGGVVGFNAAQMAAGMGANVTILDRSADVLERLSHHFDSRANTLYSSKANIADSIAQADLVIGAVLIPGAAAPKLVTREMLKQMRPGSVLVDVAIDQGGCFETSHATTHAEPIYMVDGIVHYCVANMPGAVARTSTYALNNATLPHAVNIANLGWKEALRRDPHLRMGLNVCGGKLTHEAVARDLGYDFVTAEELIYP